MNAEQFQSTILSTLKEQGLRGAIVSFSHLHTIRNEISGRYRDGEFDEKFYRVELAPFSFDPPEALPDPKSVIIVASPQPQIRISFSVEGKPFPVIVPPTYSYDTDETGRRVLEGLLLPNGYRVTKARLLLKLLAVRSGLAKYGKNNVTYVPGMGSFHRLTAFYTDFSCPEHNLAEPRVMSLCRACTACMEACPTGAIAPDRFLLRAERCITFLNEFPGEFPLWLDPSWHNCLVGCLYCQTCCPANKRVAGWIRDQETFSGEETQLLLHGEPASRFPAGMAGKLERLSIIEYSEILGRNLRVLVMKNAG